MEEEVKSADPRVRKLMSKLRMNQVVRVAKPKYTITKQFKGQFGIVIDIMPEAKRTYYKVRLNSSQEIVFEGDELK